MENTKQNKQVNTGVQRGAGKEKEPLMVVPLIPELGRKGQADLCDFETSVVYRASFRVVRATQRNPVSQTKLQTQQKIKKGNGDLEDERNNIHQFIQRPRLLYTSYVHHILRKSNKS